MKKYFLSFVLGIFAVGLLQSQIKIGNNPQNIDAASVLELESNSQVLVITRVSEAQMNTITPLQGALIYNTDEGCVFYYDGTVWVNLCEELNTFNVNFEVVDNELVLTDNNGDSVTVPLVDLFSTITSDPIFNPVDNDNTIVITRMDDVFNLEVGEITGFNIVDSSINGFLDIQDRSIPGAKIQEDAINSFLIDASVAGNGLTQAPDGSLDVDLSQLTGTGDLSSPTSTLTISGDPTNALFNSVGLDVADNAITNIKMADNAIGTVEIINDAVTTEKILDASITNSKLDKPAIPLSGFGPAAAAVDLGSNRLTNVTDPVDPQDAATRNYVDTQITTSNILPDTNIFVGSATGVATAVALSGDATINNAGVLTIEPNAVETNEIADDAVTIAKIGTTGAADANRVLGTDAAGNPEWQDAATIATNLGEDVLSTDGSITGIAADAALVAMDLEVNVDGTTLEVDATNGVQVANDGVTTDKIGTAGITDANRILGTDAAGDPEWQDAATIATNLGEDVLSTDGSITGIAADAALVAMDLEVNVDGTTLEVDATNGVQVLNDGITNTQIADDAIQTENIVDGQVQTNDIADANVTPAKLADGTAAGEILQWDGTNWVLVDDSALTITEIDGIVGNEVTNATAGGSLTLNGTGTLADPLTLDVTDGGIGTVELAADAVDNSRVADNAIQTENILDGQVQTNDIADNNVTPAKIEQGANGQVLTTDGTGDVVWAAPAEATATGTAGSIFFADGTNGLAEDNTQLFWDDTNNVLGIATNTPDTSGNIRIQVNGSTRSGGFITSDGTANTPSYRFNSDPNTGMYWGGVADELVLVAGATEGLRIDENGGIATTIVPEVLELNGTILDINNDQGTAGQILSSTGIGTDWIDIPEEIVLTDQVTTGGTAGAYTITNPAITPTSIINLTVVENNPGNPIMIQLTAQAANSFSVQIFEFIAGTFTGTNATWNYIIVNP